MADDDKNKFHEFDVEVFSAGKWNGDDYSDQDLEDMVKNFDALKETIKPPVKLGHNQEQMKDILKDGHPALGWVKSLRKVGQKLVATLTQVPELVHRAIKAGMYKRVSSEIYWNYKQGGKIHRRVFAGLALLGADIPAVTNLKDLEAYLTQSLQDASFERIAAYAFAADESGKITVEKHSHTQGDKHMSEQETKIYQDKIADLEKKIHALEGSDEKAKKYEAELAAIKKEQAEGRKKNQQTTLKEFCEQMVKDGKMPPAVRDIFCDFEKLTYTESGGYSISTERFIEGMKLYGTVILKTGEKAKDKKKDDQQDEYTDAFDEVHQKAKKYMSENKVQYSDAVNAVLGADEDLAKRYISGGTKDPDAE